ncbi:MAG: cupin domain-containing protein [Mangrovicoccus sp.]
MSNLIAVNTAPDFAPREGAPAAEMLLSGDPQFKTWDLDEAMAAAEGFGKVRTGIWEASPGKYISEKGGKFEFCHLLAGKIRLTEEGGEAQEFSAGDSFIMKPALKGQWETLEPVRKIFVIAA